MELSTTERKIRNKEESTINIANRSILHPSIAFNEKYDDTKKSAFGVEDVQVKEQPYLCKLSCPNKSYHRMMKILDGNRVLHRQTLL